jgi:D-xylose transport system substrate-binding protein
MQSCKYKFLFVIILCVILLNFSCSKHDTVKIGLILPNLVDDRFPMDRDYFIAKAKELGGEVLVADGNNDDKLQQSQAEELIKNGVGVLVIVPVNLNTAAVIVRMAHDNHIKVIAYERIIANCDLDYFISFDNVKVGEMMANDAVKLKPKGRYMLLCGDKGDKNAIWVRQGQHNVIDPLVKSGEINVVHEVFIEDWAPDNAYQEMKKYLNLSSLDVPDAILSSYDGMSTGAIKAIDENSISLFPVITGQNAELEACRNILKGKQSMTVYKPIKTEAEQAAILAMKCAKNESIEKTGKTSFNGLIEVPSILIEPISVNENNMKSTVIADGFLKESEVYKNQ